MSDQAPALARFLANVLVLEEDAAGLYARLARLALDAGNAELEALFQTLAETACLDAEEARTEGATRALATLRPAPIGECRLMHAEQGTRAGDSLLLGAHCAVGCALSLARRNHACYASLGLTAGERSLRARAQAFAHERAAHIAALEEWAVRLGA